MKILQDIDFQGRKGNKGLIERGEKWLSFVKASGDCGKKHNLCEIWLISNKKGYLMIPFYIKTPVVSLLKYRIYFCFLACIAFVFTSS